MLAAARAVGVGVGAKELHTVYAFCTIAMSNDLPHVWVPRATRSYAWCKCATPKRASS